MFNIPKPIINRKIRFALIGCGRIAQKHFNAILEHAKDAKLIAICDNNPQNLALAIKQTQAKGFSNLNQLLSDKSLNLDIIVLATPSGLHSNQVIQIAKTSKHIMTEKPMATRWQDGLNMVEACDNAGVYLFVVKQNRHNSTLKLLKQAILKKRFGRIYMVNINVFWTRPQEYYDSADWRGTWEFDGGALMNQASHYVDLLDWLIAPIESVQAFTATLGRNIEVEDTATLSIRWRSGALGSMNVTMLTYPKNLEGSITIIGEKGTVKVGGIAVNEIQHWEFADSNKKDSENIKNANYTTDSVYGFGHPLYYENVINTLRGKTKAETDGREGLRSLEVLIAAYLSARDGKRVALPLNY
jgi:UDP-N-acetyl-2-amino-2-deoxyglucuronate dehydrogenase